MQSAVIHQSIFCLLFCSLVPMLGCQNTGEDKISKGHGKSGAHQTSSTFMGTISGASMVPTLHGEHLAAECADCGFRLQFEMMAENASFVCSNCGKANRLAESVVKSFHSPQWLFDKCSKTHQLKKWDVIAFNSAIETGSEHMVKRVIGLPKETIELKFGDVYVDGTLIRKPINILEQMKVLVHDSNAAFQSRPRWVQNENPIPFPVDLKRDNTSLHYQHIGCYSSRGKLRKELIKDSYGFNQTLSRSLNLVGDFGVEVTFSGVSDLSIELEVCSLKYGRVQFSLEHDADQADQIRISQFEGEKKVELFSGRYVHPETDGVLKFWMFDGNACLVLNGIELGMVPIDQSSEIKSEPKRQKSFGNPFDHSLQVNSSNQIVFSKLTAKSGKIERIRIFRDLYYYDRLPDQKHSLGEDEYFVLGDNVPISSDSRHFGSVKRNLIIGVLESKE